MKIKFIIGVLLSFALVSIIIYSLLPSINAQNNESVEELRKKQDAYFRSEQSPIEKGTAFTGLKYFSVNEKYNVKARISILRETDIYTLSTSTGKKREFRHYAYADFTIDDKDYRLTILQPTDDPNYFFLPFTDATSGNQTYGSGRYIEVNMSDLANVYIDFNKAYNPYCAYNSKYDCPIPPSENNLQVEILAGEKSYQ